MAPARTAPSTYRWQAAHVEGGLNAAADQQSFLVNGGWPQLDRVARRIVGGHLAT